jgi:hypothetical protein
MMSFGNNNCVIFHKFHFVLFKEINFKNGMLLGLNTKCRITRNMKMLNFERKKRKDKYNLQIRRKGVVQRLTAVAGASEVDQVSKEIQARQIM